LLVRTDPGKTTTICSAAHVDVRRKGPYLHKVRRYMVRYTVCACACACASVREELNGSGVLGPGPKQTLFFLSFLP
jgi:hypothetical protein